jgi:hypothetical protein
MSIFKDILGAIGEVTGISSVGDAAKSILAAVTGNPEAEKKLQELEIEKIKLEIQESESIRNLWKEEIKSGDAFVRRARPWGLYVGYSLMMIDMGLIPLFNTISAAFGGPIAPSDNLSTQFYALFGTMFTGSLVYRAFDKRRNIGGE